jgi:hypothetical protein
METSKADTADVCDQGMIEKIELLLEERARNFKVRKCRVTARDCVKGVADGAIEDPDGWKVDQP